MNSFLTSTSSPLGSGTGTSDLYCSTSVPPVFSIWTAFMVFGSDDMFLVMTNLGLSWELSATSLDCAIVEYEKALAVRTACEAKGMGHLCNGTERLVQSKLRCCGGIGVDDDSDHKAAMSRGERNPTVVPPIAQRHYMRQLRYLRDAMTFVRSF